MTPEDKLRLEELGRFGISIADREWILALINRQDAEIEQLKIELTMGPGWMKTFASRFLAILHNETRRQGNRLWAFHRLPQVKSHHGFIDVDTQAGHGTTFHVYLPVAR
jgi:light-regulated signal transduction histidine kinase (bacteriophytochrome)